MLISQKFSPTHLNNRGVLLLNIGRYEDATRCFAIASKRLATQAATRRALQHKVGCETKNVSPVHSTRCLSEKNLDAVRPVLGEEARAPLDGYATEPPRKQTRRISANTCSVQVYDLGRPLWIQSKEQRKAPLDETSLVATLLYNTGLSFNLMAITKQTNHEEARSIYRRALTVYKLAVETMLRAPLLTTLLTPAVASVLHNMAQVHYAIREHREALKCQHGLASVLRQMCPSRGQERKQYEIFHIKLLSLPNACSKAAAVA